MTRIARRRTWVAAVAAVVLLLAGTSSADAATETVLVLDNSASMVLGTEVQMPDGSVRSAPPADPDRLSVVATLLLNEIQDPGDRLHILTFDAASPHFAVLPSRPGDIRELQFDAPTLFRGVLAEARRILAESAAERRLLIFLTDGLPGDDDFGPSDAAALLGLDDGPVPFDLLVLGLAADASLEAQQDQFLVALAGDEGRYERIAHPVDLVARFTDAYAEQLGSKPESGTLSPGGSHTVEVGKYVREVILMTASVERVGPFGATLTRNGKEVALPASGSGDNACTARYAPDARNPSLCRPPFHHYRVWKAPNDPKKTSTWNLKVDSGARSPVAFGFILRYDLSAEILQVPDKVRVGEAFEVAARLAWQGRTFDEDEFFDRDGFEAVAIVGDRELPLARQADSTFSGTLTATDIGKAPLRVEFRNRWMRLPAARDLLVEGYLPLSLSIQPSPVDFGGWRGAGKKVEQCQSVRIDGENASVVPLDLHVEELPEGLALRVGGAEVGSGDTAHLPVGTADLELCAVSLKCCADIDGASARLLLRGRDAHYHPGAIEVPIAASISAAGFVRCWLVAILVGTGLLLLAVIAYGLFSPKDFLSDQRIRLSGSEAKLKRASAMVLREMPGGRRGFYRNATVGFDASGSPLGPRRSALLRLEAAGGGELMVKAGSSLETKDRRSRKWVAASTEAGPVMLRRRIEYRVGDLYFRIE